MPRRTSGILLHPTSLPGPRPRGDLGPAAFAFVDWLAAAGVGLWQFLPLGPPGAGRSPYSPHSAFAGDPELIAPEPLVAEGLLEPGHPLAVGGTAAARGAFDRFSAGAGPGELTALWEAFRDDPRRRRWLDDWALYAAAKERFGPGSWQQWPPAVRARETAALDRLRGELAAEIERHAFAQLLFDRQWRALREHAAARGISLLGDLPIYVALDSADVWSRPDVFLLGDDGRPPRVAGVPPDDYCAGGQLWGNPLYRWPEQERDGYGWWVERTRRQLELADLLRLDHFRGFVAYWTVAAGSDDAVDGRWEPGPGRRLFERLEAALGGLPFVAEDLGVITDDVRALRSDLAIPCTRVLQFAFDDPESEHLPERVGEDTFLYTGTHDNDTANGWWRSLDGERRERALAALGGPAEDISWRLIGTAWRSPARVAVAPVQDLLGLGSEARLNTPGRADGNWGWRMPAAALTAPLADRLRRLGSESGRAEDPAAA